MCVTRAQLLTRDLLIDSSSVARNYTRRYIRHYLAKYRARFSISPYANTCQGFRVSRSFCEQKLLHCTERNARTNRKTEKRLMREDATRNGVAVKYTFWILAVRSCVRLFRSHSYFDSSNCDPGKYEFGKCKSAFSSEFLH